MVDRYKKRLQHAQWTWREEKVSHVVHGPSRRKDRRDGRNDKRSAKQEDRAETEADVTTYVDNVRYDNFLASELMELEDE